MGYRYRFSYCMGCSCDLVPANCSSRCTRRHHQLLVFVGLPRYPAKIRKTAFSKWSSVACGSQPVTVCAEPCAMFFGPLLEAATLEAQATAMDFRRVEPKFRKAALALQVSLSVIVLCYAGYKIKQILDSSTDPPVELATVPWKKNLGMWHLCSLDFTNTPSHEFAGVGTGVLRSAQHQYHYNWTTHKLRSDMATVALPGAKVHPPQMTWVDDGWGEQNCSSMDLTEVDVKVPFFFVLCIDGGFRSAFFVKIGDDWEYITHHGQGYVKWFSLQRSDYGWNLGYSSSSEAIFSTFAVDRPLGSAIGDRTDMCQEGMTWFQEPRNASAALVLSVVQPQVVVFLKQGIVPQLFQLVSNIGGFLTVVIMVFTCLFVKKYPESAVFSIYEARTLAFENIWPSKRKQETDSDAVVPVPLPLPPGMFREVVRDTE